MRPRVPRPSDQPRAAEGAVFDPFSDPSSCSSVAISCAVIHFLFALPALVPLGACATTLLTWLPCLLWPLIFAALRWVTPVSHFDLHRGDPVTFYTTLQFFLSGRDWTFARLHCTILSFCSGDFLQSCDLFTPIQLAFCGGARGTTLKYCCNLAFCSGAHFTIWESFTQIQLAFCGGAFATIYRHCHNLAFCSGASYNFLLFCTHLTLESSGVVIDLDTTLWYYLAFCSGAPCILQWRYVWRSQLEIWLFALLVVTIRFSNTSWTATHFNLDSLCLQRTSLTDSSFRGDLWRKTGQNTILQFLVRPFWVLLLLAFWTLEHPLGLFWTFWSWQQITFSYFFSGFDRLHFSCQDRILGALRPGNIPGPKSGHSNYQYRRWKVVLLFLMVTTATQFMPDWSGGEGDGSSMGPVETPMKWDEILINSLGVKQHGQKPTTCFGTSSWPTTQNKVVKRSLRRALRRVNTHGMAWYRGQCLTNGNIQHFSGGTDQLCPSPIRTPASTGQANDVRTCHRQHAPRHRISCLMWNSGGLSNHRLDELRTWMDLHHIQIGVFPESRWTFTNEWSDSRFHYIHTGDPQHQGQGILVMIATHFCNASNLQWQELQAGRLLHVRLHLPHRDADLLACYQHTQRRTQACQRERERWWQHLDEALHTLPTRNTLLMMGDFNCSVPDATAIAGPPAFKWKGALHSGPMHSDAGRFLSILKHHGIATLNTWDASQGPSYVHADAASRIDYFCTRLHSVDGESKRVQALWQASFLDQMQYGHVPLLCSYAKRWVPPGSVMSQRLTHMQKQQARTAYHDCTGQWCDFALQISAAVPECFATACASDSHTVDQLHATVMDCFQKHFPVQKTMQPDMPWQHNRQIILSKWEHRRRFLTPRCFSVSSIFRSWFHIARFQALKRQHRRLAYRARQIQFEDITRAAACAADHHDMHTMFKIINNNSPKQPKRRIQLRKSNGLMATPTESADILTQYVSELWAGPPTVGVQFSEAPGVPFSIEQLTRALQQIPVCKATAPPFAPGAAWRAIAETLAPRLYAQLEMWWSSPDPFIPPDWKAGWLVMIPKPQKPPVAPGNLRPLAMQCPIGKSIMGLLITQAVSQAYDNMISWPIFAYMPGRSTMDSIFRVAMHCSQVRQLIGSQRATPHQRANPQPRYKICGGFQIFVDIQRAFDAVSRSKLFRRLSALGIHSAHINLISRWHEHTEYHVQTDIGPRTVPIGTGLRQGCKAAPALWNFFIILFFHDLSEVVPIDWIKSCVTVYADDCHIGGIYKSEQDFKRLLEMIGILFKTLTSLDMNVNPAKTVAILAMTGTSFRNFKRQVVHRDHTGEYVEIAIPGAEPMKIHLQHRAKYLGVVMSYTTFEKDTLRHRTTLAHLGFSRLRRWLCGRQLSVQRRFKLWVTCIYPILSYGIFAMMHTHHTVQQLQKTMIGMIRKILRDFAFLTQHTHAQALEHHCIPAPLLLMRGTAVRLQQSVTQRCRNLPANDIMTSCTWTHLDELIRLLDSVQETNLGAGFPPAVVEAIHSEPRFQCSVCEFQTDDVSHFRRHCTQEHLCSMQRTHFALAHLAAVDGLPTCKHCLMSFTSWRSFQIHLDRGCQALWSGPCSCTSSAPHPAVALLTAPDFMQPSFEAVRGLRLLTNEEMQLFLKQEFGGSVVTIVQNRAWEQMARASAACDYLARRCFLCERQFGRIQELNAHFRQFHSDLWHGVPEKAIQLSNLYANDPPCAHCGSPFKTHICPVFVQLAVMLLHGAALDEPAPESLHDTRQRCELCLELLPTSADLAQHLQTVHQLHGLTFNASRDVLPNSTACSHCGIIFQTIDGVKSHVVQGRCQHFDPRAAAETLEVDVAMKQACIDGKLKQYLQSASTRMRLTIRCQMCGKGYSRAADLAGHLQTAHSRLWRQALRLTQVLVSLLYEPGDCCCNPSIGHKRTAHICVPLRQIAMSFHRLEAALFAPVCITDDMLLQLFSPKLDRGVRFLLESALTNRDFAKCWTDPEFILIFSTRCFQCGQVHSPEDLCLHVREAHFTSHPTVAFYMERFLIVLHSLNQMDHQCGFCEQVFNLPSHMDTSANPARRFDLVQSHFKGHCPVALQLAILFARILHGGRFAHEHSRCGDFPADLGHLPTADAGAGQGLEIDSQSQTAKAVEGRREKSTGAQVSAKARGRRKRPSPSPPATADLPGDSTRPGTELAAKKRFFCDVFQHATRRSSGSSHQGDAGMEEPGSESLQHGSEAATSTALDEEHAQRTTGQGHSDCTSCGAGQAAPGLDQERPHHAGQVVALSPVEPHQEGFGAQSSPTHLHGENAGAHSGAPRDDPRSEPHLEVQRLEGHRREPGHSLAVAAESTCRHSPCPVLTDVRQHGLDTAGHQPQDAHASSIQFGQLPPGTDWKTTGKGSGQRGYEGHGEGTTQAGGVITAPDMAQHMITGLYTLKLLNTDNWCYANSSLYCLLWSLLCLSPFDINDWGLRFAELSDFLHRHRHTPAALAQEKWFQQILTTWGHELGQQDCAEFFHALLTWMKPAAYDMRWERRVQNDMQVDVADISSHFMPLHLQFDFQMLSKTHCKLTELVHTWSQAQGMTTALVCAPQLLCIHLDRLHSNDEEQLFRSDCSVELDCEVTIPVFLHSGLKLENVTYVPIAAAAHLGHDQQGHYRAALKMTPSLRTLTEPVRWLLTDDAVEPVPMWNLPTWFAQQTTLILLARTDCLLLPLFSVNDGNAVLTSQTEARTVTDPTPEDTDQMLLTLMQNQAMPARELHVLPETGSQDDNIE